MKKVLLSLLLSAALLLSACGRSTDPPQPIEPTEYPTEKTAGIAAIDHCVVEPDERCAMSDSDREQYRRLMDAMLRRDDSVTLDADAQRTAFLLELLRESPYYFFTSSVTVDGSDVRFTYAYDAARQERMLAFIDTELLGIANHLAAPDDNELDIILKVYSAVGSRFDYDTDRSDNKQLGSPLFEYPADEVYKALRDNRSLCYGFAYILRLALLQRGIDAFCVYGQCHAQDMGHEWVVIRYDGEFFHCDPGWDRTKDNAAKLMHFGTTDVEREADTLEMRPFADYHLSAYGEVRCTDGRFSIFRGVTRYTCLGDHRYRLEDRRGDHTIFDSTDFSVKKEG